MTTKQKSTIVILGAGLIVFSVGYLIINYLRKPTYYTYEVLENFSVEYYNILTNNNKIANFKKGQIIQAKLIPVDTLITTPDGKIESTPFAVILPKDKIKRL